MTLTFTSGQTIGAQLCALILALDDSLIEDVETFNISFTATLPDGNSVRFAVEEAITTVRILQDPNDSMLEDLLVI